MSESKLESGLPIEGVVFDLDGTLIDSSAHILSTIQKLLLPYGLRFGVKEFEALRHRSEGQLFTHLLPLAEAREVEKKMKDSALETAQQIPLFSGVKELVKACSGLHKAVWTGRDSESARKIMEYNGVANEFSMIIGHDSVKENKPNPEGLIRILSEWRVAPSRVVVVGDHDHDRMGASAAGCQFVFAAWCESARMSHGLEPSAQHATVQSLTQWLHAIVRS